MFSTPMSELEKFFVEIGDGRCVEVEKVVKRINVNTATDPYTGLKPLAYTLQYSTNPIKVLEILIRNGVDLNQRNDEPPLIYCIRQNKFDLAKYLIHKGANACLPDKQGQTPLSCAIRNKNMGMIQFLLDNGADFTIHTALITAVDTRNAEMIKFLVEKGASLKVTDQNGYTPFLKLIRLMDFPMVKYLVERGVDINQKSKDNQTALSISLSNQDFRMFDFLIKSGADLNLASKEIDEMVKKNKDLEIYMENLTTARSISVGEEKKKGTGTTKVATKEVNSHGTPVKLLHQFSRLETKFTGHEEAPEK
ncbi:putative ankyrin repeat protein RF_0381 isoform X1 [Zophobas morio]|uniref:putative ankyrin repeat protein RF_0381 isoform X1 n=1 Tax=Zophobas morio TaxID=2755281 RepID=UPI0030832898